MIYKIDWQSVGDRLKMLQNELNIKSSRQFAFALSVKGKKGDPSYIAKAEKGEGLSDTYINAIEEAFHVNGEWLRSGRGKMFGKSPQNVPHETRASEPDPGYSKKEKSSESQMDAILSLAESNVRLARSHEKLVQMLDEERGQTSAARNQLELDSLPLLSQILFQIAEMGVLVGKWRSMDAAVEELNKPLQARAKKILDRMKDAGNVRSKERSVSS